jgi:phage terminase large subunit
MGQTLTVDEAVYIADVYRRHPSDYVRDVLGSNTWAMQDEITESVFKYKITAVKTCNAVGKSYIAARIAIAYLMLHPGSIVVTTAPTWRQVTDVLWREIATAKKQSKYHLTDNDVRQAGLDIDKDWYAVGLSTNYPENFFGYHANHILVIVDEAGGVPEPIFKGVKAITPNANARILYIGNPTNPSGTFFDQFDEQKELAVNRFTISAFQTPNFTANGINTVEDLVDLFTPPEGTALIDHIVTVNKKLKQPYPALIDPSVVYERYKEWGTDSPAWQALVMGEFPTQSEQSLFPVDLVTKAMNMYGIDDTTGESFSDLSGWNIPDGPMEYGLDMARYGTDNTVLFPRHGGWVDEPVAWNKVSLMDSAQRVLDQIDPLDFNLRLNIDDTGNGGGTTDRLIQLKNQSLSSGLPVHQYQLSAYNFSSKEFLKQPDKFHDITSELYWNLRSYFIKKQIALHYDRRLFSELVGRRWGITTTGKIKVESKDEYKKRTGGKSPDYSDALALAFAGKNRQNQEYTQAEPEQAMIRPLTAGLTGRF